VAFRKLAATPIALALLFAACSGATHGKPIFRVARVVPAGADTLVVGLARTSGKTERCADERGYVDDFAVARVARDGHVRSVSSLSHERLHGCVGQISSALLQPDGALLLSGWVLHPGESGGYQVPVVTRFRRGDGVDDGFGNDGLVGTGEPAAELALAPDGTIVTAAGSRLGRDGSLEPFRASVPGSRYGEAIAPLPGGGFVVAVIQGQEDVLLAAFERNGRPDPSFGRNGRATARFAPAGAGYRQLLDLVADPAHGKLLVLGTFVPAGADYRYVVYRFGIDGQFERSFAVDPGLGRHAITSRVAIQADGKVVALGAVVVGERNKLFVARYTAEGRRDRGFGRAGVVLLDLARASQFLDYEAAGAVLADGKLVVAGSAATRNTLVYRLRSDGSLDRTFARGGRLQLRTLRAR
jgi:uncharacterized delta-60 repeat protein